MEPYQYPYYQNYGVSTDGIKKDNSTKYIIILSIIFIILGIVFLFFYLLLESPASTDTSDTGETFGDSGETSNSS